jgi:dihydroxy-acid dehydratase
MTKSSDECSFIPHFSLDKTPENAERRTLYKSIGITENGLKKPIIGIANSWNELVPGHYNLRQVSEHVKKGIYSAGGTAVEFGTIAACDGISQGEGMYAVLPTREIIAASIELMVQAHNLDGIVMLGSCDKIIPGMLMAAARLNIPAILLPGGPMLGGGLYEGRKADTTSVVEAVGKLKNGEISEEEFYHMENTCAPTYGSCAFYGSANTMCCISEAMGLVLSTGAGIPAVFSERMHLAEYTGEKIVSLVKTGIKARDILTLCAIKNGIIFANATGGSTNTVLHLIALAHELGIPSEVIRKLFEELGHTVPQIALIYPNSDYLMEDFYLAGGVPQVLKELREILDTSCMTVDGITLGEVLVNYQPRRPVNRDIIKTVDAPYSIGKGLAILYGNLAPAGCVTKPSAIDKNMLFFTGRARTFHSEEEASSSILQGDIHAGDIVVIRYEGPKGGPGMREMFNPLKYLHGLGLALSTAVITDGRFSGTNNGCFVGHISPEAAECGPLAAVEDGDIITIDIPGRKITLQVEDYVIQERLAHVKKPEPRFKNGYLAFYSKHATSASEGGILE